MVNDLSQIWIFSDVDGTLVEAPDPIPNRNLEALKRFTEKGGHFALATGRSTEAAIQYVSQLPVNAPCIIFNGSAIYDFNAKKMLYAQYLPETWKDYIEIIRNKFPSAGITLFNEQMYTSVSDFTYVKKYLVDVDEVVPDCRELSQITEPCIKSILVLPEDQVDALHDFIKKQNWEDVSILRSSPFFVEILPPNTDKGSGLRAYSRLWQVDLKNVVAIGDYYNDEAMMKIAGTAVTVNGAPDDIKSLCQYIMGDCRDGALADLVELLELQCK